MSDLPFTFAQRDLPLAPETYYRIGGPARLALLPGTVEEAAEAFRWMLEQDAPRLVMGCGSNMLIAEHGFPGNVLLTRHLCRFEPLGNGRFQVQAGLALERLVEDIIVPNNFDGAGVFTGIPGSVGGALYMNAGTANGATCVFTESVELVGKNGIRSVALEPSDHGYRSQSFCGADELILAGVFRFTPSNESAAEVRVHYLQRRKEKQPFGFCCGSVFKNPPGDHAARLIEACGLKGTRHGGAVISPLHANFIMNEDAATFDDVMALIELCKARVHEQLGIVLEEEVRIIDVKDV